MDGPDRADAVASERWEELLADAESIADEYRDEGWEAYALHPGHVATLTGEHGDRTGLDVLVSGGEFEPVADLVGERGVTFDASEVYSASEDSIVLLIVVMEDHDERVVVVFPAYYDLDGAGRMFEEASAEGELRTYLRTLDGESVVFAHDDPSIFAPPDQT